MELEIRNWNLGSSMRVQGVGFSIKGSGVRV